MEAVQQSYMVSDFGGEAKKTMVHKFLDWCKEQEDDRLLWLSVIITCHVVIITPLTVLLIVCSGNSLFLWSMAIVGMAMSLVVNLAALPAKIIIPLLFLSIAIDLVVITACIASGLSFPGA